ncbi:MAG: helix-hairpin-helix domain-containing protein, partial [bacterium]
KGKALQDFLMTYYEHQSQFPPLIVLETELPDPESTQQLLEEWADRSISFEVPQQGEKKRLIDSARRTAELAASEESVSLRKREGNVLATARDLFNLSDLPRVIEGFDVSHNQGEETVASMVRFVDGEPEKSDYRRFKIRDVEDVDDYDAMREVVRRRYTRLLNEEKSLPDLIFVDGGRGQLTAAREVIDEFDVDLPVASLAKQQELIFIEGREAPYDLPEDSKVLQMFQRIRDEAHRFAITYHRDRRQGMLNSRLKQVEGIGDKRLKQIMDEFGSPVRARQASLDELTEISGITEEIAREIKQLDPAKE